MTDKPYYTVVDVEQQTGINRSTVAKWLGDGKFSAQLVQHGSTKAYAMTEETFETVCQHAIERKAAPRQAMTVNPNRKKAIEAEVKPQKWGSMAEMIAKCRTARKIAPGEAEGAEVWA